MTRNLGTSVSRSSGFYTDNIRYAFDNNLYTPFSTRGSSGLIEAVSEPVTQVAKGVEETAALSRAAQVAETVGEGATILSGIESSVTGPATIAMMASQQIGSGIASQFASSDEERVAEVSAQNSSVHGLNAGLNSSLVTSTGYANANNDRSLSSLGATLMGPVGAIIGHAISAATTSPVSEDLLKNDNSFEGRVNPQDSGIVASQSTAAATGNDTLVTS